MRLREVPGCLCRLEFWLLPVLFGVYFWADPPARSPLWERLVSEAPTAWKRHREYWATLEGTARSERRQRLGGSSDTIQLRQSWKQWGNNILNQEDRFDSGFWKGYIRGENPRYRFRLQRSGETKPWVVVEVKRIDKPHDNMEARKNEATALYLPEPPVALPELFQSAGFQVTDVSPEPGDKEGLVRVTFQYTPKDVGKDWGRSGLIVLDPSRDWVIRRTELEYTRQVGKVKVTNRATSRVDYKEDSEKRLSIRSETRETIRNNGAVVNEITLSSRLDLWPRQSIPESEFTLSAYGLPEPRWARPDPRPWYLWFGIGGIVCLALGAGAFWLKRRRVAGGP